MIKIKPNGSLHPWRFRIVIGALGACCAFITWQIVQLHVLDGGFLRNQGDKRSLRATAPLIAAFRSGIAGGYVHNDINGDGRSDLLFHNPATRQFSYRIMNGTGVTRAGLVSGVGAGYHIAATGDFNGDTLALPQSGSHGVSCDRYGAG